MQKRDYRIKNKNRINKYERDRRATDPIIKLRSNCTRAVNHILKGTKNNKSILKYLPYSMEALKQYIEKQFEPWMNWSNIGKYNLKTWNDDDKSTWTWNIDHIIPQSDLPYISMEDDNFKKCWALENLRPLSAKQNILDGNRKDKH